MSNTDVEGLKAEIKKLNARATQAKMNLHDLSEELPVNWEQIPQVAQQAFDAYQSLIAARERLAATAG